jgi:hypothetical protein
MLTDQLRSEAKNHAGNLEHARKSDRFIASKLENGAEFLQRLMWEKEQISGLLPTADLLSGTTPTLNVSVLKDKLAQLDHLLYEREQKLAQLKELSTKVQNIFPFLEKLFIFSRKKLSLILLFYRMISLIRLYIPLRMNTKPCLIKSCKSIHN